MPIQHIVTYQAFCEITNFICNNGNEFCTNTAHTTRKAEKAPTPPKQPSKHKTTENQAFCEITNFICNNGNKFCTNTAHTTQKAKKAPTPPKQPSKHKTAENEGLLAPEPLPQENPHRFVLFPIHHANIWQMYKKAKASFWTVEEINLTADIADWDRLSANECHFITYVLAFFAAFNCIVLLSCASIGPAT